MAKQPALLIIDGYNMLHHLHPHGLSSRDAIERAREALIRQLAGLQGLEAEQLLLVFDGQGASVSREPMGPGMEVLYSRKHQSADALIEGMLSRHPAAAEVLVVSSDHAIDTLARACGCQSESVQFFANRLADDREQLRGNLSRRRKGNRPGQLGDFFP